MSSQQLQIAMRFKVRPKNGWDNVQLTPARLLPIAKDWFNKDPDHYYSDDDWKYDYAANQGWTINLTEDHVFIDYIFNDDLDVYNVNRDIYSSEFQNMATAFAVKFLIEHPDPIKMRKNHPVIQAEKLKILYFHNSRCAGISEIS